jgi:pimeloyl-ACP methyl ester carboxylesterase
MILPGKRLQREGKTMTQLSDLEFTSKGVRCSAWSLKPGSDALKSWEGVPCVVMAHGFGGTRDAGLEPYARRFAAEGMHVLLFDYRHFGASEGEPRQLLSIGRQLDDWTAAADFARTVQGVDPNRIALFGTSFSGGHVVEAAVRDGKVRALVSQCPMMDGLAALKNLFGYAGVGPLLRLTWTGIRDVVYRALGMGPVMVPIVSQPGKVAAMSAPDAESGYMAIAPPNFRNEVCAGIALNVGMYRPGLKADRLPCPILIQICDKDSVAPAEAAEAAAQRAGDRARVKHYPIGHFDIYVGENFERSVSDQVDFLKSALGSSSH